MFFIPSRVYSLDDICRPALAFASAVGQPEIQVPSLSMKTIDASKARKTFARVLENVRERKENVVIVRYGRPIAALVPIGQLPAGERKRLKDGARR